MDELSPQEALIREIHHRVKNNLQMIVSLLHLQATHTDDPHLIVAFKETEGRVRAIAHLHERTYATDDLTEVEFSAYLTTLAQELVAMNSSDAGRVKLHLDVCEMVLHIEQAVPLGLIANELITNSLKHAFKDSGGALIVTLSYVPNSYSAERGETADDGWAQLRVQDSGPGLPAGFNIDAAHSMSFHLIRLLVRQVRGRLEIGTGGGADFLLAFPLRYN